MALDTLVLICQDVAPELDTEIQGHRPLHFMLPKFIQLYTHPDPHISVQAIHATSQFILLKSHSLTSQLDNILTSLYSFNEDIDPRKRQELGRIMTVCLEAFPQKLEPYLVQTIEFMIQSTHSEEQDIVLVACDFWEQYAHLNRYKDTLVAYLPTIIPCLLKLMVYSDTDLLDIQVIQEEQACVSATRYYHDENNTGTVAATAVVAAAAAAAAAVNKHENNLSDVEEEESDFDDDYSISTLSSHRHDSSDSLDLITEENVEEEEFYSQDTTRNASARALETISLTFGDDVATILLDRLLGHTLQDKQWVVRESGILALGAAAVGKNKLFKFKNNSLH